MATRPMNIKRWQVVLGIIIVLAAIGYKIYILQWPTATVTIDGSVIPVLVADTPDHEYEGWSDKKNMGKYGGMLFVFPSLDQHTMVMRDMEFPLDIIWIADGQIVDIAPDLPPEWHVPEANLIQYSARLPSTAVLELPAGFALAHGLKLGDAVTVAD